MDAATGEPLGPPLKHGSQVYQAVFSPDGRRVVTTSRDGSVRVWDALFDRRISRSLKHPEPVGHVALSPDGRRFLTNCRDGKVRIWDAVTCQPVTPPLRYVSPGRAAFSPDGRLVVTTGRDGVARVWNATTGEPVTPPLKHNYQVSNPSFSPDSRHVLVTCHLDHSARVWDVATGELVWTLKHRWRVNQAAFSPDGRRVVTTGLDDRARVWDMGTGQAVFDLPQGDQAGDATFSPDGRLIVTSSMNGTAQVWDANTGRSVASALRHQRGVYRLAFSPDSRYVATTSEDSTARVWDAATGRPITPPLRHAGVVSFASFSPDGRCLLTTGLDGMAHVWDAATGHPLAPPLNHSKKVPHTLSSPDGRQVFICCKDETLKRWDLDLSPDRRPIEDLMLLAQLFNGHRLDAAGDIVPLEPAELESAWRTLRAKYPGDFAVSPAEVLAWHQCEAGECERLRLWAETVRHLDHAIQAEPARWFDRAARGRAHAELGQWAKAVTDLAQAVELGANDGQVWYHYVLAHLAVGDGEASRRVCGRLLERFGPSKNPSSEHWVARACVLAPDARADFASAGPLADKLEQLKPTSREDLRLLGALLYRAGRFDEAVKRLNQALKAHAEGGTAWDWLFLAMAHQRLGEPEKAEEWLNKAGHRMEQAGKDNPDAADAVVPWDQRLELELLRREAQTLLKGGKP